MRMIGILVGAVFVVLGIPLLISPIPLGLLLIALGILVLTASSPWFASRLKALRAKFRNVDEVLDKAEEMLPPPLSEPLRDTDPEEHEETPARTRTAGQALSSAGPASPEAASAGAAAAAQGPPVKRADPLEPWRRLED